MKKRLLVILIVLITSLLTSIALTKSNQQSRVFITNINIGLPDEVVYELKNYLGH